MPNFRPKEVFRQAQIAEKAGRLRTASQQYASVAIFLRRREKFREARTVLKRAIQLAPESARLHLQLAVCEMGIGDLSSAQQEVKNFAAIAMKKRQTEIYRPYLETQLKELPALRQVFYEACLETDRTSAQNFLELAKALVQQKKWEDAQKTLINALKTRDQAEGVVAALKEVLTERGLDEAAGRLEAFAEGKLELKDLLVVLSEGKKMSAPAPVASPVEEKSLHDLIHALEEQIGGELDEKPDTVQPLLREFKAKANDVLGKDAKARIDMALAFFEMGLMDAARDELSQVAPTDPLYLEGRCLLGQIHVSEGGDLGALEVFQACLRDDRIAPEVRNECQYQLIQIYFRLGDYAQALQVCTELERHEPSYRDLRALKRQVSEHLRGAEAGETHRRKA